MPHSGAGSGAGGGGGAAGTQHGCAHVRHTARVVTFTVVQPQQAQAASMYLDSGREKQCSTAPVSRIGRTFPCGTGPGIGPPYGYPGGPGRCPVWLCGRVPVTASPMSHCWRWLSPSTSRHRRRSPPPGRRRLLILNGRRHVLRRLGEPLADPNRYRYKPRRRLVTWAHLDVALRKWL